jgi:Septum formation
MAESTFEHADEARQALHVIVSDPAYGADTLSSPQQLSNLLTDYLPDAPREVGVLIAAAQARVSESLSQHVSQGMNVSTAIRLTASSFANSTAFAPDVCEWVTSEIAIALGLDLGVGQPAGNAPPVGQAAVLGEAESTHVPDKTAESPATQDLTQDSRDGPVATELAITSEPTTARAPGPSRRGRLVLIGGGVAAACALVITLIVASSSSTRGLTYYQLARGDCLSGTYLHLGTNQTWPETVLAVSCNAQHVGEVYFAGPAWPRSQSFPGGNAISLRATIKCNDTFISYVGVPYTSTPYRYADVAPDATSWASGDRRVLCTAYRPTASQPNGAALHKSVKGAG